MFVTDNKITQAWSLFSVIFSIDCVVGYICSRQYNFNVVVIAILIFHRFKSIQGNFGDYEKFSFRSMKEHQALNYLQSIIHLATSKAFIIS